MVFTLIAAVVAFSAAAVLIGAYVCWYMAFRVEIKQTDPRETLPGEQYDPYRAQLRKIVEEAMALEWEDVFVTSRDGLRLHGLYHESDPAAPVALMMHGYRSIGFRDFSGGILMAANAGYNILLTDQRGHGQSEGRTLTFGIRERFDCLDWVNYVNHRFGAEKKVVLMGVSMGASTVLMAAGLDLPENVKGVVADCGYSSPREIIRKVMGEMRCPLFLYPLVRLSGLLFGRADMESCTVPEAMAHCRAPVLFIHGEDDRFVPCAMGLENYAACVSEKILLTVPGAGHALSFMVDTPAYERTVGEFFERIFR